MFFFFLSIVYVKRNDNQNSYSYKVFRLKQVHPVYSKQSQNSYSNKVFRLKQVHPVYSKQSHTPTRLQSKPDPGSVSAHPLLPPTLVAPTSPTPFLLTCTTRSNLTPSHARFPFLA